MGGLAHSHPLVAHVVEASGARRLIVKVGDEFAEDPRLIGIRHTAVAALDYRLGDDSPPREVPQACPTQLATVDSDRRGGRVGRDLIGDRQHAVESMLASDVQVAADLVVLEGCSARLDLDEACPTLLAASANDGTIWDHGLTGGVLEPHLGVGLDDRGLGRAELAKQGVSELRHGVHHREQARGGALLLLILSFDPSSWEQPRRVPRLSLGRRARRACGDNAHAMNLLRWPVDATRSSGLR